MGVEARLPEISVLPVAKVGVLQTSRIPQAGKTIAQLRLLKTLEISGGAMGGTGEEIDTDSGDARAGKRRDAAKGGSRGAECKGECGEGTGYEKYASKAPRPARSQSRCTVDTPMYACTTVHC